MAEKIWGLRSFVTQGRAHERETTPPEAMRRRLVSHGKLADVDWSYALNVMQMTPATVAATKKELTGITQCQDGMGTPVAVLRSRMESAVETRAPGTPAFDVPLADGRRERQKLHPPKVSDLEMEAPR